MPPTASVHFHLETDLSSAGDIEGMLRGWIFAANDAPVWAVRGHCGQTIALARYGLPRPDVARAFDTLRSAGISGFQFGADDRPDRIEWLDDTGHWQEFWRAPHSRVGDATYRNSAPSTDAHAELARAVACNTRGLAWGAALQRTRELLDRHLVDHQPDEKLPDVYWHLDVPRTRSFQEAEIRFGGWALHARKRFRRLFVRAGPCAEVICAYPLPRPDVVAALRLAPTEAWCGFAGSVRLSGSRLQDVHFRLYGEYADGSVDLITAQRWRREYPPINRSERLKATALIALAARRTRSPTNRAAEASAQNRSAAKFDGHATAPVAVEYPTPLLSQSAPALPTGASAPLISILTPVYNPPAAYLIELLASIQSQSYAHWELCLADDASTEPHVRDLLEDFTRREARARVVFREHNGQISRASNSALALATGDFVALVDHDDLLPADALFHAAEAIKRQPDLQFLYTDRDKIDDGRRHYDYEPRSAWNPAMALTHNYLHQLTVLRRTLIESVGGFRADLYGSQDLDLYLRCLEHVPASAIVHLPVLGYHWRAHPGSTAIRGDQKDYMFDSARRAIADALDRRGLRATPFLPEFAAGFGLNLHQLRWDPALLDENPVSVIVAVPAGLHDRWKVTAKAILESVPAAAVEIIVATAGDRLGLADVPGVAVVVGTPDASPASLFNLGAAQARHARLLLAIGDLQPRTPRWLEDLSGWLSHPGVGAAGPKLLDHRDRLRSAGWTIRADTRVPHPLFAGDDPQDLGVQFLPHAARDAMILDPACLLTETRSFRELGGFDATRFPRALFAADYCLRLRERSVRSVFTPQALLGVGAAGAVVLSAVESEQVGFRQRHSGCVDPWFRPAYAPELPGALSAVPPALAPWMPANTQPFPGGWACIEHPAPSGTGTGWQSLHGWCLPCPGGRITEMRLVLREQVVPVILGEDRPDLAAKLGCPGTSVSAGFRCIAKLIPGTNTLRLDAFLSSHGWVVAARLTCDVSAAPARDRHPGRPPMRLTQYRTNLFALLDRQDAGTATSLLPQAREIAAKTLRSDETLNPCEPFHGHLDLLAASIPPFYGGISIGGWLLHDKAAIRHVLAAVGGEEMQAIKHGLPSPHLRRQHSTHHAADHCAFAGWLPMTTEREIEWTTIRVWAELDDGSRHLVMAQPARIEPASQYAAARTQGLTSRVLLCGFWATLRAAREAGHAAPPWAELMSTWTVARARYPRQSSPLPGAAPLRFKAPPNDRPPHLLLVSHNLKREGAPFFLLDLARHACEQAPTRLTLVSSEDGELRQPFEALGATIVIVDRGPLWSARSPGAAARALRRLAALLDSHRPDLVIANTIESFWAVHVASHLRCPSFFYVHEPGVLGVHYPAGIAANALPLVRSSLAAASMVMFPNEATRSYYQEFSPGGRNYRCLPGWTHVADRPLLDRQARTRIRAALGFAPHEIVVVNVGTLCPRKGQLTYLAAIRRMHDSHPALASLCRFLLIGEHDNAYGEQAAGFVQRNLLERVSFVAPTPEVQAYFDAAELFVSSSMEEGFPRVVLEAMAAGVPIVATAIHGVPEIVVPGVHALLVPPGDASALAGAMAASLLDRTSARARAERAQARVRAEFGAARVIPRHLAAIRELLGDPSSSAAKTRASGCADASPTTHLARSDRPPSPG